jgi:hypothetical protein
LACRLKGAGYLSKVINLYRGALGRDRVSVQNVVHIVDVDLNVCITLSFLLAQSISTVWEYIGKARGTATTQAINLTFIGQILVVIC